MKALGWQSARQLFLLLALAPDFVAAQAPASNLQIIQPLLDRIAGHIGNELLRREPLAVWLQPLSNPKPEERFLFSRCVTVFQDSLHWAVFAELVTDRRITAVTPQLTRCEIVYRQLPRRRFWLKARWQRTAYVVVEVNALNPATRQFDFQKIFSESHTDTVAGKFLSRLDDAALPFTVGRREERAEETGWLEPVLIASATGAMIYMFYSLRSR